MALIRDRIVQVLTDKMADKWADVHAVAQPSVPFLDVLAEVDDGAVLAFMAGPTQALDDILAAGSNQWQQYSGYFTGLLAELSANGYSLDSFLQARGWRLHRYAAALVEGSGRAIGRVSTFAERTELMDFEQGGAATAGATIPTSCGGSPLYLACGAGKGVGAWTPVSTVVHESPVAALVGAIGSGALALTVADESEFPVAGLPGVTFMILLNDECCLVTATDAGGAPAVWTVTRAQKGTAAVSHTSGTPIYFVSDENGAVIPASCSDGREFPVRRVAVTTLALSGQAVIGATGIGGTNDFALDNMSCLIRDRTCPQKLTADCAAVDEATVEDASVFHPGDYCIIDDDNSAAELATVRNVDGDLNIVYFDDPVAGTFTMAQNAILSFAWTTVNEGGAFAEADMTLTVTAAAMLPAVGECPYSIMIEDEICSVTNIAANNLTLTRGVQGTLDTEHPDGSAVILCPTNWNEDSPTYNRGVERGSQEWVVIGTAAANQVTLQDDLNHTYGLAASIEPLCRRVILVANGAGGNAGDLLTVATRPDAVIARAD